MRPTRTTAAASLSMPLLLLASGDLSAADFRFRVAPRELIQYPFGATVVSDFDSNGHPDFLTASAGVLAGGLYSSTVALHRCTSPGVFATPVEFVTETAPRGECNEHWISAIAAGDLDGNGTPDVVVGHAFYQGCACGPCDTGSFSVLTSGAGGLLQLRFGRHIQSPVKFIHLADIDSDGDLDLVLVLHEPDGAWSGILTQRNLGNATFDNPVEYPTLREFNFVDPGYPALADFDGDGLVDIAVSQLGIWLPNVGGGVFGPGRPIGASGKGATSWDVDNNGTMDLVVETAQGVAVLKNNGAATFVADSFYAGIQGTMPLVTADLNHDGRPDLVVASTNGITVLSTVPNGSLAGRADYEGGRSIPLDYDQNGSVDLISPGPMGIAVLRNLGDGTLSARRDFAFPVRDFDLGGYLGSGPDAALGVTYDSTVALPGLPGGFFGSRTGVAKINAVDGAVFQVRATRLNSDDLIDAVVTVLGSEVGRMILLHQDAPGHLVSIQECLVGARPTSFAVTDVNADGFPDIVSNGWSSLLAVLLGDGAGRVAPERYVFAGIYPEFVQAGHFDGNGLQDVVVAGSGGGVVLLSTGAGTFASPITWSSGNEPTVVVCDLNDDGLDDLISRSGSRINQGDGHFGPPMAIVGSYAPISTGDFDGDGGVDLLTTGATGLAVMRGDDAGAFAPAGVLPVTETVKKVVVADVDANGYDDVLVLATKLSVYLNRTGSPTDTGARGGVQPLIRVYPSPTRTSVNLVAGWARGAAEVSILDARGRLVRTLHGVMDRHGDAVTWDGCNEAGALVSSGTYFAVIVANGQRGSQKIVLIR